MATDAFSDFVVGHGELWSAQLLAAAVRQRGADVEFMDTRDVLVRAAVWGVVRKNGMDRRTRALVLCCVCALFAASCPHTDQNNRS